MKLTKKQQKLLIDHFPNEVDGMRKREIIGDEILLIVKGGQFLIKNDEVDISLLTEENFSDVELVNATIKYITNVELGFLQCNQLVNAIYNYYPNRIMELYNSSIRNVHHCLWILSANDEQLLKKLIVKYNMSDHEYLACILKRAARQEILIQFIDHVSSSVRNAVAEKIDRKYLHFCALYKYTLGNIADRMNELSPEQILFIANSKFFIDTICIYKILFLSKLDKSQIKEFIYHDDKDISKIARILYDPRLLILE